MRGPTMLLPPLPRFKGSPVTDAGTTKERRCECGAFLPASPGFFWCAACRERKHREAVAHAWTIHRLTASEIVNADKRVGL